MEIDTIDQNPFSPPLTPPSEPGADDSDKEPAVPDTVCCGVSRGYWMIAYLLTTFTVVVGVIVVAALISASKLQFSRQIAPSTLSLSFLAAACAFSLAWCYRRKLWFTPRAIVQQSLFAHSSIDLTEVSRIVWCSGTRGDFVEIHAPQQKLVIPFQLFEWRDQIFIVIFCRQLVPVDQQSGWNETFERHWRYPVPNDGTDANP